MKLQANIAGMATSKPTAVAINEPAPPGAIAVRLAEFACATLANVFITPPDRPGAEGLPAVLSGKAPAAASL